MRDEGERADPGAATTTTTLLPRTRVRGALYGTRAGITRGHGHRHQTYCCERPGEAETGCGEYGGEMGWMVMGERTLG